MVFRAIFLAFDIEKYRQPTEGATADVDDLQAQLESMDRQMLVKQARGVGVDQDTLDDCDDEDNPKQAVIDVLLRLAKQNTQPMDAAREELEQLGKISLLKKRARKEGVSEQKIDHITCDMEEKSDIKEALIRLILDALSASQKAEAEAKGIDLEQSKKALREFRAVFVYVSDNTAKDKRKLGWARDLAKYLDHPCQHMSERELMNSNHDISRVSQLEIDWMFAAKLKRYSICLKAPDQGLGQWTELQKLFSDECIHFFLQQAARSGNLGAVLNYLYDLDTSVHNSQEFVNYLFELGRPNQIAVLQRWHDDGALTNETFAELANVACRTKKLEVLLQCLVRVILVTDSIDAQALDQAPWIIVQNLFRHRKTLGMDTDVFQLFELVLRWGREDRLFADVCHHLQQEPDVQHYIAGDFLENFCKVYFRTVCVENEDGNLSRQNSVAQKGRSEMQISAAILGYVKLCLFTAPGEVGFARMRDFLRLCERFIYNKLLAVGSRLLEDMVNLLASSGKISADRRLLPEFKKRLLTDGAAFKQLPPFNAEARGRNPDAVPRLCLTPAFFTTAVQSLVTQAAVQNLRSIVQVRPLYLLLP